MRPRAGFMISLYPSLHDDLVIVNKIAAVCRGKSAADLQDASGGAGDVLSGVTSNGRAIIMVLTTILARDYRSLSTGHS